MKENVSAVPPANALDAQDQLPCTVAVVAANPAGKGRAEQSQGETNQIGEGEGGGGDLSQGD